MWINKAEERTGGESSLRGGETGSFIGSGLKERHGRVCILGGGLKKKKKKEKKAPCTGIARRGFLPLLLTPGGFIVYSKPHLRGVLGQAQRERSLVKMRLLIAPMR